MNLTTLANVKQYLTITGTNQDALITPLIARESALVEAWTGRTFPSVSNVNKRLNGTGTSRLVLPDQPILSVSSLSILGSAIPASPDGVQAGFVFDDTCLYLVGGIAGMSWGDKFPMVPQSVTVSWEAGYQTSETDFVPTGNTPTITPTQGGTAVTVVSVVDNTTSTAMTQVGSSPATGQYSFSAGVFTFNTAQYNHSVTMTYKYVPAPVEQAVIEMVGLDLQQRNNIGINSKNLATESITYEKKGISDSAMEMLRPYRRMVIA
ncbi:MAG TPA: hypothetical protein VIY48_08595 [Candidatus Paceibacterota bacterium]